MNQHQKSKSYSIEKYFLRVIYTKFRKETVRIVIITMLGAVLEALSVAIIPALFTLLKTGDGLNNSKTQLNINILSEKIQIERIFLYALLIFILIFIIKTVYLSIMARLQAKFIYNAKAYITETIYSSYIKEDYKERLKADTASIIGNITNETHGFVVNFMYPIISLLTETLVLVAMIAVAIYLDPIAALGAITITTGSVYILQNLTKTRLTKWGFQRQKYETEKIRVAQQGIDSIKQIKLLGIENYCIQQFIKVNQKTKFVEINELTLSQLPRLWLEAIAVIALGIVIILGIYSGKSLQESLSMTGLFALIAFRLMPTANRILVALQKIRYSESSLSIIRERLLCDLPLINQYEKHKKLNWTRLKLSKVSYSYENSKTKCLYQINFEIQKGDCIGIIGPSGVGKSTLLDIILTLLHPTEGDIDIDGVPIDTIESDWKKLIGYVPQSITLIDDSIIKNVAFGVPDAKIDKERASTVLFESGLHNFITSLPENIMTKVGERGGALSGGQRQRLAIARALYRNPDILVFDEATSALDRDAENEVLKTIASLKGYKTIILISHRKSTLSYCDKVYKLSKNHMELINLENIDA